MLRVIHIFLFPLQVLFGLWVNEETWPSVQQQLIFKAIQCFIILAEGSFFSEKKFSSLVWSKFEVIMLSLEIYSGRFQILDYFRFHGKKECIILNSKSFYSLNDFTVCVNYVLVKNRKLTTLAQEWEWHQVEQLIIYYRWVILFWQ